MSPRFLRSTLAVIVAGLAIGGCTPPGRDAAAIFRLYVQDPIPASTRIVHAKEEPHPTEPVAWLEFHMNTADSSELIRRLGISETDRTFQNEGVRLPGDIPWFQPSSLGSDLRYYGGLRGADTIHLWMNRDGTHIFIVVQEL